MSERINSYVWFLRQTAVFENQTESMYQSADLSSEPVEFARGQTIPFLERGQKRIYLVIEGQVKLRSITAAGKEIIIDIASVGDVMGDTQRSVAPAPAASPAAMATDAVAMTKVKALRFELEYFNSLIERRPTIVVNLNRMLGLRQRRLELRLTRLLYRSSLGKVAGLLSELGQRYGTRSVDGTISLDVRLTHQEMASIVGTKRETVSESLAELELRELIAVTRSGIVLLKPEELNTVE
jgi:CRP/FNR family transcriptional regulator